MALENAAILRSARDELELYYLEKIWEWIPEIHRHEDGIAPDLDVLRSLARILAGQAAVARRSADRLWEDQFIDFADDWAIAYLGDLLGTRPAHELNRRGRRAAVAKTLFYRRRKGTPQVMESLIRDLTGWEGVVVEAFRRLGRTRHRLDPEPAPLAGRVTGTPPGGFADLARPRGGDLVDGPFDEYAHTADFRRLRGFKGRLGISKLNFHLYRLAAFRVVLATPFDFGERRFTFDPSGRDLQLFRPRQRPGDDDWRPVSEWEIPAPLPCRLLGSAAYRLTAESVPTGLETELAPLVGERFVDEPRLIATLETVLDPPTLAASLPEILAGAITADSPKLHLIPEAVAVLVAPDSGEPPFGHEEVLAGNLAGWTAPASGKPVAIDPVRGRLLLNADPNDGERVFVPVHHYGFSGPLGAGTYDRRGSVATEGVTEIEGGAQTPGGDELDPGPITGFALPTDGIHELVNSKTYVPDAPPGNVVEDVDQLRLQAADGERPYLRLVPGESESEWLFRALPKPPGADPENQEDLRWLEIEGIWIGIVPSDLSAQVLASPAESCAPVETTLVLDGVFDRVVIGRSTLDPGGEQARLEPLACTPVPAVALEIRGQIEELCIDSSITGPIRETTGDADPCSVGRLVIRDSIVQSLDPAVPAIATRVGEVHLERVTVFGDLVVNRLFASEALVQGIVRVTDNQHGCFRFSAAADGEGSRLPPRFESHLFPGGVPNRFFVSRRFGDPGYAQLSEAAPAELRRGAENGSEIGAFSALLDPIKLDDLRTKVNEYMPFGLIAQYIHET